MESNIKIKDTPKLNISSAVFGDKDIAGDSTGSIRNIHKTLSKLSGHVRKSLIRIKGLEEKFSKVESKIEVNSEKITRIKKVLQTQKGNIGKKLPGGSNVNQSLVETNRILVEIQKQITTAFGMRNEEEKEKNKTLKQEKSKEKLRLKEGVIESVRKIGGAIKKTAQFVAAPFKGFFDKILEFISLLGLGIGANAVFKWFEDEENRRKLSKFFNIIVSNWKLIRNILGTIILLEFASKFLAITKALKLVFALLTSKPVLIALTALAALKIGEMFGRPSFEAEVERREKVRKKLQEEGYDEGKIQEFIEKTPVLGVDGPLFRGQSFRDPTNPTALPGDYDAGQRLGGLGLGPARLNLGGLVPGSGDEDTTPAMLTPGEYVIKKSIVKKYGKEYFESINNNYNANVDGSIINNINNVKTQKIYQMISSKDAGKINFITMELPPKVMKKEQQDSTQQTASPVPSISPVNVSNPYMNTTPEIYGIYV